MTVCTTIHYLVEAIDRYLFFIVTNNSLSLSLTHTQPGRVVTLIEAAEVS